MSLYESGDSTGKASIGDMLKDQLNEGHNGKIELDELAHLIVRGEWPENVDMPDRNIGIIPRSYIDTFVAKDMYEGQARKRDPMTNCSMTTKLSVSCLKH